MWPSAVLRGATPPLWQKAKLHKRGSISWSKMDSLHNCRLKCVQIWFSIGSSPPTGSISPHRIGKTSFGQTFPIWSNFPHRTKLPLPDQTSPRDQTFPLGSKSNFPQGIDCCTLRDNSKIPVWNTGDKLVLIIFKTRKMQPDFGLKL